MLALEQIPILKKGQPSFFERSSDKVRKHFQNISRMLKVVKLYILEIKEIFIYDYDIKADFNQDLINDLEA